MRESLEMSSALDLENLPQQARRVLDRLGYEISPLLWKVIHSGLLLVAVRCTAHRERDNEIFAFEPQEYWSIEALIGQGTALSRQNCI